MLSSGIVPSIFASVESEAQEDIQAGCRDGQMLVYRTSYQDYVCVDPSTADRWVELGLAELVGDYDEESSADEIIEPAEELIPVIAPTMPERTPSVISDNSECREGYTLVYRINYKDTFCTSPSTASTWERLGLAMIIGSSDEIETILETNDEQLETNDEQLETNDEQLETNDEQLETNDEQLETNEEIQVFDDTQLEINDDTQLETNDELSLLPQIYKIDTRIWIAIGYDVTHTVLIEGDKGIIAIDPQSSYGSSKTLLADFKSISEKPIKTIIFTILNPGLIQGSTAFIEAGDGSVEIIANNELLDNYHDEYDLEYSPTHTYDSEFRLDISGVKIDLYTHDGTFSDQTYISLPDDGGILIGDSKFGISPYLLEMDYFQSNSD